MLELLDFLNRVHPINPETQYKLGQILRKKELRKNQLWLQEGATCDKIAFIETGLVKVYFDSGSKEVCLWYNKENEVTLAVQSFFGQIPSKLAIRAIVPTTLYYITYSELQEVYDKHLDFNINGRRILEHYYSLSEAHVSLLLQPIKMRYQLVEQLYPWMLTDERITDKMMAAYLGMTTASFYACKKGLSQVA